MSLKMERFPYLGPEKWIDSINLRYKKWTDSLVLGPDYYEKFAVFLVFFWVKRDLTNIQLYHVDQIRLFFHISNYSLG